MVNSSLAYEILVYINSFYFGLFATCEFGTLTIKAVLLGGSLYTPEVLGRDSGVLVTLIIVEAIRLYLGRKGSLSERDVPVLVSVVLTLPSIAGVVYLLTKQIRILRIEYIWCSLMLCLQLPELFFALIYFVTMCREPTYD